MGRQGNIAVFCSGGEGSLQEFVCENAEPAEELVAYFENMEKTTSSVFLFSQIECAKHVAREFSDKGLYCFDADDRTRLETSTLHQYDTKHADAKNH